MRGGQVIQFIGQDPGQARPAPPSGQHGRLAALLDTMVTRPASLFALMLVVAVAARAAQYGNPVVQVDDEFYLLVGDRMLHGALPFVDIWDRKPIGLFLLYAGIRLLGGDGVLQYQLVATLFAAGTGFVAARIAGRIAPPHGAAAAGLVYILYLGVFGGEAGQSPVFYTLFVAIAAWLMVRIVERPAFDRTALGQGAAAMLLMGLSLQIKYSTLFEGIFFGTALLAAMLRAGWTRPRIALAGALFAALGALPTLLAWVAYAAMGHGDAFLQTNVLATLARGSDGIGVALKRLRWMVWTLLPLGIAAWCGMAVRSPQDSPARRRATAFIALWAVAAIAGVLIFGTYFDHYALPLLLPLTIAAAPILAHPRAGLTLSGARRAFRVPIGAVLMGIAILVSVPTINQNRRERGWGPQVHHVADVIRPRLKGCLFVFHGDPSLYRLTDSCLPTRWMFPSHLSYLREAPALGIDPIVELHRILAARPQIIVTSTRPEPEIDPVAWKLVETALARDYRLIHSEHIGSRERLVYERQPGR